MPPLEITEVVLLYCNIINNDYQQNSRVFYTLPTNKPFGHPPNFTNKFYLLKSI